MQISVFLASLVPLLTAPAAGVLLYRHRELPAEDALNDRQQLEPLPVESLPVEPLPMPVSGVASEADAAVQAQSGEGSSTHLLRDANGTVEEFGSCISACSECFRENYQSCLAYCKKGCQAYCDEVLPEEECKAEKKPDELWVARIGSIFDLMRDAGQLCQLHSPDGCPMRGRSTTPLPGSAMASSSLADSATHT
eukprot:gb/GFBE01057047.1/.p1 GENE.gb/GFBE01057047.1/~~gb/GFBE01057047.1/.p1  ORF type:complete len:195 (+),score=42.91 gb/GFBE01057047.1/:1-585(+)